MANPTISAIQKKLNDPELLNKLTKHLSSSELNSLLLEVMRAKAETALPAELMHEYSKSRFVQPSSVDALAFNQMEGKLFEIGQKNEFFPLECSPLAPLGNCSSLALVNQNKVVSALRGTEVVADITNLMALEVSVRRKALGFDSSLTQLCAVHRHVRAQALPPIKGFTAHFKIFCAVTAGKDTGSFEFEKQALLNHFVLYRYIAQAINLSDVTFVVKFLDEPAHEVFSKAIQSKMETELRDLPLSFITVPKAEHQYYQKLRFSINMMHNGKEFNIGDGGFLDWTQKLTSNKKERLFTSALGIELLLKMKLGMI